MQNLSLEIEKNLIELDELIFQLPKSGNFQEKLSLNYSTSAKPDIDQILELQDSALELLREGINNPSLLASAPPNEESIKKSKKPKKTKKTSTFKVFLRNLELVCDSHNPHSSPLREKIEPKINLRSNEKPILPVSLHPNLSNIHKKSKVFSGKADLKPPFTFMPPWLKEMHAIDFGILGDIILLNNEEPAKNNHKKPKKAH